MFVLHDQQVTCCLDCPHNKAHPNGFMEHVLFRYLPIPKNFLPPTHRCDASLDTVFFHTGGHLIMNPNVIPKWCPFEPQ